MMKKMMLVAVFMTAAVTALGYGIGAAVGSDIKEVQNEVQGETCQSEIPLSVELMNIICNDGTAEQKGRGGRT
jgi:hypothetical protein